MSANLKRILVGLLFVDHELRFSLKGDDVTHFIIYAIHIANPRNS